MSESNFRGLGLALLLIEWASSMNLLCAQSADPFAFARQAEPFGTAVADSTGSIRVRGVDYSTGITLPQLYQDARILLRYGESLSWPPGLDPVIEFEQGSGAASIVRGVPFLHLRCGNAATFPPTGPGQLVVAQGGHAVIWNGRPAPAHGSPTGVYGGATWPSWKSDRWCVMRSAVLEGTAPVLVGILRVETDGLGAILSESFVLEEGAWIPALGAAVNLGDPRISTDGRVIVGVGFDASGMNRGALWLDGQIVLQDGDGLSNTTMHVDRILPINWDVNSSGSWVCEVRLSNGALGLVRDGALLFDAANPSFPTGGSPFTHLLDLVLTEDGRVIWKARAQSFSAPSRTWLLVDGVPIYDPAVHHFDGRVVADPDNSGGRGRFADPEGAFATTRTYVTPPLPSGPWVELVIPLLRSQQVCDGPPTSFGSNPTVEYLGSTYVDSDKRYLVARGLPPNATVLWLQSPLPGSIPLPAGGQGTICLGPPIARRPATTDMQGTVMGPSGLMAQPGRQHYQVWYRDVVAPGGAPTSRVSDAVVVDLN